MLEAIGIWARFAIWARFVALSSSSPARRPSRFFLPAAILGCQKAESDFGCSTPARNLPDLLVTWDDANREVEYYCYDRLEYPVNLTDDDFNPDVIWAPKPKR